MSKKVKHRWRWGIALAFSVALFGAAAYLLGWSSMLPVKNVTLSVTGPKDAAFNSNDYITQYLKDHRSSIEVGAPIARLKIGEISHQISQLEWVRSSSISRGWFSGKVFVRVHEREPVATMGTGSATTYIDKEGVAFHSPKSYGTLPEIIFPVNGSNNASAVDGTGSAELHSTAAQFVTQLPTTLINTIQTISIFRSDDIEVSTNLRSPTLLVKWGGLERFTTKLSVLSRLLELPENNSITVVDLTDPSSPIVR